MPAERVTVTLPAELLARIDRLERNRSRFIAEAIRHELERRRLAQLRESLAHPHPESADFADAGFEAWAAALPEEDVQHLVDLGGGTPIRWVPGEGWVSD
jgi:post-segregation antitoxin (ccd killing protein)